MTLNLQAKESWIIFDDYGMAIVKVDENSWKDSLGRTVLAWIAYDAFELEYGIESCLDGDLFDGGKWKLYRHPKCKELSSRDHWSYLLIYKRLLDVSVQEWVDLSWFKKFVKKVPRMRGMNLWMHSLTGNKGAERAYYLIYIPGALIGNIWLKFCRWAGDIWRERSNRVWINVVRWMDFDGNYHISPFGNQIQYTRSFRQKLWAWIIFQTMPAYALHNKAWQIYVMPDSKCRKKLDKILLKRVDKSNIMLRLLLGDTTVTKEEIDNYPHMTGYRPGVYLDETCRRTIRELTVQEAEFNTYGKDLIKKLYNDMQ